MHFITFVWGFILCYQFLKIDPLKLAFITREERFNFERYRCGNEPKGTVPYREDITTKVSCTCPTFFFTVFKLFMEA